MEERMKWSTVQFQPCRQPASPPGISNAMEHLSGLACSTLDVITQRNPQYMSQDADGRRMEPNHENRPWRCQTRRAIMRYVRRIAIPIQWDLPLNDGPSGGPVHGEIPSAILCGDCILLPPQFWLMYQVLRDSRDEKLARVNSRYRCDVRGRWISFLGEYQ